jgi:hypothetical protein
VCVEASRLQSAVPQWWPRWPRATTGSALPSTVASPALAELLIAAGRGRRGRRRRPERQREAMISAGHAQAPALQRRVDAPPEAGQHELVPLRVGVDGDIALRDGGDRRAIGEQDWPARSPAAAPARRTSPDGRSRTGVPQDRRTRRSPRRPRPAPPRAPPRCSRAQPLSIGGRDVAASRAVPSTSKAGARRPGKALEAAWLTILTAKRRTSSRRSTARVGGSRSKSPKRSVMKPASAGTRRRRSRGLRR